MAKTTIAGLLLVMLLVGGWTAEAAVCKDENGNPIPCEQDPGGGGIGGDPCSISQKGACRYMTIYPGPYPCTAGSCMPDPAAPQKCAGFNTQSCQIGTDAQGKPIMVMINDCTYCYN